MKTSKFKLKMNLNHVTYNVRQNFQSSITCKFLFNSRNKKFHEK